MLAATYDGLRLATILCCIGAANTLANPKRALRSLPAALYELGVTITVAVTVAPQLVESAQRVNCARKLRGDTSRGRHALRGIAMPVLHDALDRSFQLAAAMDSRGYGRSDAVPARVRRTTAALMLAGLLGVCVGTYSLLDTTTPRVLGLPMLASGIALGGGRPRARRPPDPAHAVPARSVALPRVEHRDLRRGRRGDGHRSQRARRERAQPVAVPARVAHAPAASGGRHPLRARTGGVHAAAPARRPAAPPRPPHRPGPGARGSGGMIRFEHVTITYPDADRPVLLDVDLDVPAGELCVVVGATGTGKSTLLGTVNGLVPHFTGGTLRGRVSVDGRATETFPPRELADVVGVVTQDPLAGCVTDTLEEELAYGMEQLAIDPGVMRKRVEETLDLLGLADLRHRALHGLSAGQLQRVAIGAVLTAHPKVLVLDEPTSALDPTGAEEVLAAITRLVHDLGVTVVMAEHRLERVVQYADRVLYLPGDGSVVAGEPDDVLAHSSVVPPVVELGLRVGWRPLPLSVRDARRCAALLTDELASVDPPPAVEPADATDVALRARVPWSCASARSSRCGRSMSTCGSARWSRSWAATARGSRRCCGRSRARARATSGTVDVGGADPAALEPAQARLRVGLVPHNPSDLLYLDSVGDELARSDAEAGAPAGTTRATLDRVAPGVADEMHPRDLSEGQRLALVLAIQLAGAPTVLLLDEPTRGLDYRAKRDPRPHPRRPRGGRPRDRRRRPTTSSSSPKPRTA